MSPDRRAKALATAFNRLWRHRHRPALRKPMYMLFAAMYREAQAQARPPRCGGRP